MQRISILLIFILVSCVGDDKGSIDTQNPINQNSTPVETDGGNGEGDHSNNENPSTGGNNSNNNNTGDNSSGDNSSGDNSSGDNSSGDNSNGGNTTGGNVQNNCDNYINAPSHDVAMDCNMITVDNLGIEIAYTVCSRMYGTKCRCPGQCNDILKNPPESTGISAENPPADLANAEGHHNICHLCKNQSFPENTSMVINVLYLYAQSCSYYYWLGRKKFIPNHLCDPLQHFAEEPCGCK